MSVQEFEMELEVGKRLFYNEETMFGIYSCKPVHYTRELSLNTYGSVALQGTTRMLTEGERYDIRFSGSYPHERYGDFYKISEVAPEKLNTITEQDKFLRSVVTDSQFNSLKKAYPDEMLVDLIMDGKIDTKKTKGIKSLSLAKIKQKIEQNAHISILIAKLNSLNLSTNAIDKLLGHFKTSEKVVQAIDQNIYSLCEVRTFGFKTVDKVAIDRGDEPTNENRIKACIEYLLKEDNAEGHTWSPKSALIGISAELLNIKQERVEEVLLKNDVYIDDYRVARKHIRKQELEIYEHLKRIHESYVTVSNVKGKIEEKIILVEEQQGFQFTDEQKHTIIDGSQHGVMVVNGGGGVGKTASVKGLIDSIGTSNYMTSALSGKAVNVLSQRGIEASTIHRMLGFLYGEFTVNEDSPLLYDVLVLDEMSMIDVSLILSVLRAVKDGTKLILVGDSGQLPAIGYGDVLRDLLATQAFPTYELTQVHRQATKSGILSLANSIRAGNQVTTYNSSSREVFGELQDQTVITYSDKDAIPFDIIKIAESYKSNIKNPEDLLEFQVIVSNRERGNLSVKNLNIQLQKVFNDIRKPSISRNGYEYREGDKIIAQGNTYKLHSYLDAEDFAAQSERYEEEEIEGKLTVYNGTMGIIKDIYRGFTLIQFEGIKGLIPISQNGLDKIDMAYSITTHKSQGSSISDVIFALDYGAYKLLSKQLVYTAITRASRKGVVLAENNALITAIGNDASGNRRTFLGDIMGNVK